MKLFRMIKNGVRDAFKSVYRNFSLSLASVSCISITLIVVSLALLVAFNVENFSQKAGDNITIVTYLNLGVTEDEIEEFEQELNKMSNVSKGFEDTKQTPEERKKQLIEEDDFLSNVATLIDNEEEVFHYRYDVKVIDIDDIEKTRQDIKSLKVVSSAEYGEETTTKMVDLLDSAGKVSIVVAIILMVVTVFLIVNTIKLTIFSRRREISIMRVVGASNLTIKNPFIIEGFIIGVLGSIVPVIATIYGYTAFYNNLDNGHLMTAWLEFIDPYPFIYLVSLIIVAIGALVGMFGSSRAVRKYLKV